MREFYDRFRQVASKASQAMSKLKQIERMELIEKALPPRKPFRFQIPQPPRSGAQVMALNGIHMAYGDNVVYRGLDLSIERDERTVLVGPNGAGKSTLLKILAGVLDRFYQTYCLVDQGFVKRNSEVSVKEHVAQISKQLGDEIVIRHFVRFQVGEAAA